MPNQGLNRSLPSAFSSPEDDSAVPVLFQVLSPDQEGTKLIPHALFLHVNPNSLDFSYSKVIARSQTRGGFIEQHFGEELTDISADQSTGAFINTESGLAVEKRKETPAWRKLQQLVGIFKSNGSVYDDKGNVKFRGRIQLTFAGGIYEGFFTDLEISEEGEKPFEFNISWTFNVEEEKYSLVT